jgi:hypothetical protein
MTRSESQSSPIDQAIDGDSSLVPHNGVLAAHGANPVVLSLIGFDRVFPLSMVPLRDVWLLRHRSAIALGLTSVR